MFLSEGEQPKNAGDNSEEFLRGGRGGGGKSLVFPSHPLIRNAEIKIIFTGAPLIF